MRFLILALAGLGLLLGAGVVGVVWFTRWLARRTAERFSVGEFDAGLAIPMRDCDTRRKSSSPSS